MISAAQPVELLLGQTYSSPSSSPSRHRTRHSPVPLAPCTIPSPLALAPRSCTLFSHLALAPRTSLAHLAPRSRTSRAHHALAPRTRTVLLPLAPRGALRSRHLESISPPRIGRTQRIDLVTVTQIRLKSLSLVPHHRLVSFALRLLKISRFPRCAPSAAFVFGCQVPPARLARVPACILLCRTIVMQRLFTRTRMCPKPELD